MCDTCSCWASSAMPSYPYRQWKKKNPLYKFAKAGNVEAIKKWINKIDRYSDEPRMLLQFLILKKPKNHLEMIEVLLCSDVYWGPYLNEFFAIALTRGNRKAASLLKGKGAKLPIHTAATATCWCLLSGGLTLLCSATTRYNFGMTTVRPKKCHVVLEKTGVYQEFSPLAVRPYYQQVGRQYDVFISHSWTKEKTVHPHVVKVAEELKKYFDVFIDSENFYDGNLNETLLSTIRNSHVFVVLLTKKYNDEVNEKHQNAHMAQRQFTYALSLKKPIMTIIMEPGLDKPTNWGNRALMNMGEQLFVDFTTSQTLQENFEKAVDMVGWKIHAAKQQKEDEEKAKQKAKQKEAEEKAKAKASPHKHVEQNVVSFTQVELPQLDLGKRLQKQETFGGFDLFLSHAWGGEEKKTHNLVVDLSKKFKEKKIRVWIDHDMMKGGDLSEVMASGIRESKVFVAFLTQEYIEKVDKQGQAYTNNVKREFLFAVALQKPIICVVLEEELCDKSKWGERIRMELDVTSKDFFFIDLSTEEKREQGLEKAIELLQAETSKY